MPSHIPAGQRHASSGPHQRSALASGFTQVRHCSFGRLPEFARARITNRFDSERRPKRRGLSRASASLCCQFAVTAWTLACKFHAGLRRSAVYLPRSRPRDGKERGIRPVKRSRTLLTPLESDRTVRSNLMCESIRRSTPDSRGVGHTLRVTKSSRTVTGTPGGGGRQRPTPVKKGRQRK